MTNEEIQRTMEFILQGQARFDARMEKDEARLARLEDAFVTLVEMPESQTNARTRQISGLPASEA